METLRVAEEGADREVERAVGGHGGGVF
jgi:hypothetical protein